MTMMTTSNPVNSFVKYTSKDAATTTTLYVAAAAVAEERRLFQDDHWIDNECNNPIIASNECITTIFCF